MPKALGATTSAGVHLQGRSYGEELAILGSFDGLQILQKLKPAEQTRSITQVHSTSY